MEEVWRDYMSLQSSSSRNSPPSPPPQQPGTPPPPTALSLGSTLEFTYLGGSSSTSGADPDGMIFAFAPEPRITAGGDRRHRRMIKNRESAARSRARKQSYTNELELELAQLRRENAMLLKLHQELNVRLAPDRPVVQRCRSAPL
ncbi:hypothetical protein QOZ80_2AG0098460 [Eleusine coracana subsp. coracana]|nr:hypothetical protein QOZ80_2AG0098460 [Eleusine coracana subsp. coracana]